MAGLFNPPKLDTPSPPNPYDTQNRLADEMTRRLQSGGTLGDTLSGSGPGRGLGLTPGGGSTMPGAPAAPSGGGGSLFSGLSARTGLSG
jgi:hypothetical protein